MTLFVRYKNNNFQKRITIFKKEKSVFFFENCYFYISQTKSNLYKIFYNVVYHHVIYMNDFLVNLDDFFTVVCTSFHEGRDFHPIRSLFKNTKLKQNTT